VNRHEKRKRAIQEAQREHAAEFKAIYKKAEDEDREPNDDERLEIEGHVKSIEDLNGELSEVEATLKTIGRVKEIGEAMPVTTNGDEPQPKQPARAKSLGQQFIESKGYQLAKEKGFSGEWNTGQINLESKATLVEGDNTFLAGGTPGAGADLVPLDQRSGVLPILFERLTVADLFASGSTQSNAVNYVVESVATNAAAVVAEGGAKPESTLEFSHEQEAVKKIATFLPVSDEMLEDAPAIQSYINSRLTFFVRQEEEEQLLDGEGGSNFLGLKPRIPADHKYVTSSAEAPNSADHIYEAITRVRVDSFLEPDGIIVHPEDWADLRLLKDTTENYIGGSPFSTTGQGEPGETLWGKRVVITQACYPGTAVVGAFNTAAQVFRRGGLSVEASNSHASYFTSNLTAIRAEARLVLAVYRPSAFAIADIGYPS
jgi:HK97 family phage major capsid protein